MGSTAGLPWFARPCVKLFGGFLRRRLGFARRLVACTLEGFWQEIVSGAAARVEDQSYKYIQKALLASRNGQELRGDGYLLALGSRGYSLLEQKEGGTITNDFGDYPVVELRHR